MDPLGIGDPLRLGPYRLIGVLGEGGMGKVYLGRDSAGGVAAVKVLRPELAYDQQLSQRFVREAQAAQAVESKGIARVLATRTEGGRPWIASEFLAGPTLDQAVDQYGPLDDLALRALGTDLAHTLHDIHAAGLVHRDLKPPNIVLTSSGPRVIDFGIARPEYGLTLTTTGQAPVTPGYGAPEQVLGQRVGPPGDVFALGAVLAFAATGRRAYEGDHVAAVQYEVVHGAPRLWDMSEAMRAFVLPCLAKEPGRRPLPQQIAAAMAPPGGSERIWRYDVIADEIGQRESAAKRLVTLPAADAGPKGPRPSRRRLITALAAGGATLAVGGGAAAWWSRTRDHDLFPDPASTAPPKRWDAKRLTAGQYEEGTAPAPLWGPRGGGSPMAIPPVVVRDLVVCVSMRGHIAYAVTDGAVRWRAENNAPSLFLASSDRLIVTADLDQKLIALDVGSGKRAWTAEADALDVVAADGEAVYFTTSEDGQHISGLRAFDIAARSVRWTVPLPTGASRIAPPVAAVADGRLVLCGTDPHADTTAVDTRTGHEVWRLRRQAQAAEGIIPAISDGVVYLGGESLTACRLSDGKEKWSVQAKSPAGKLSGGWGGPTVNGGALFAVDGPEVRCLRKADGSGVWTHKLAAGSSAQFDPPVVQGDSVWVAGGPERGVTALHRRTGKPAWTYSTGREGSWRMAAAGNRVFLKPSQAITAMPVF